MWSSDRTGIAGWYTTHTADSGEHWMGVDLLEVEETKRKCEDQFKVQVATCVTKVCIGGMILK